MITNIPQPGFSGCGYCSLYWGDFMENKKTFAQKLFRVLTYILVAAIASGVTFFLCTADAQGSKLAQLEKLILDCFVGDVETKKLEDAAAHAMVTATGDQWSYYIPADQYASYVEQMKNAYVGIGVTIAPEVEGEGIEIRQVDPNGGAFEAGIQAGDVMVEVEGQKVADIGLDGMSALIRGEENTQVAITVLRADERITFSVTRRTITVTVAQGQMLEDNIGLVAIYNFDERCAHETLAAVQTLVEQGAQALIFDVRFNPGGYKSELVEILDYLLPEGPVFHSQTYDGQESISQSDAQYLDLPMAVLVNAESYSAAEFFAAALNEYDRAVVVGEPTVGKGYFQTVFELNDGSAVGLSIGKYFTPNGVSLAEAGGLKPEIELKLDEETAAKLYAGELAPEDDPHVQAAIAALKEAS